MDYKYIGVPKTITIDDCKQNEYVFAPSKYSRFLPSNKNLFVPLSKICTERNEKVKVDRRKIYHYSETGDIDVYNGSIQYRAEFGLELPSENPKLCKPNDILISTVRTYRGGFGMLVSDKDNHCCSPAIIVIKDVSPQITKEYLLAILRTDFFIEQILGFQTRGMYPRLDSNAMDKVVIPIPSNKNVIRYVSTLMKACLNKYQLIRQRHADILRLIDEELKNNQKPNSYTYHLPTIQDLQAVGRLDTGLYTDEYKYLERLVLNYTYGTNTLTKLNYKAFRGPNLAISIIGITHYSNKPLSSKYYRLIQPMDLSDFGTLLSERYFGNKNSIPLLKQGDILFGAEGNIGKIHIMVDVPQKTVTNFHGMSITNPNANLYQKCFVGCYFMWLKANGYFNYYSVGGQGGSYGIDKTNETIIPNFPDSKQREIATLYHNPIDYQPQDCTIDNFIDYDNEFNTQAGIYELDKTAKQLRQLLNQAIDNIVQDKPVDITF